MPRSIAALVVLLALGCGASNLGEHHTSSDVRVAPVPTEIPAPAKERSAVLVSPEHLLESPHPEEVVIASVVPVDGSSWTDDDLARLARFSNLRTTIVGGEDITVKGLQTLIDLPRVEAVLLISADVQDSGLAELRVPGKLKSLGVLWSKVTAEGAADFRRRHPEVVFDHGELGLRGIEPSLFDANGCPSTYFRKNHMRRRNLTPPAETTATSR